MPHTTQLILCASGALCALIVGYWAVGRIGLYLHLQRQQAAMLGRSEQGPTEIITEAHLQGLPPPVGRFMMRAKVIGTPLPWRVKVRQRGRIRTRADSDWMSLTATQIYTVDPPAFLWIGEVKAGPLTLIKAVDSYGAGRGDMLIKLLSSHTLAHVRGPEMDHASLLRYLNEMIFFPGALLGPNISWRAIDDTSAEVRITDGELTASGVWRFNEAGDPINFTAERMMESGKPRQTWSTPLTSYREINGIRTPVAGSAVWHLESGEFKYIELTIIDLKTEPSILPTS